MIKAIPSRAKLGGGVGGYCMKVGHKIIVELQKLVIEPSLIALLL